MVGFRGQGSEESPFVLSSVHQRRWRNKARAWEEVAVTHSVPYQQEMGSLQGPQAGGKHKLPNAGLSSRGGGGPSRIIFLTPLQEGLMTLSKDGVACGGGGVGGFDIPGRSPKRPEELAKKEGERIVSPLE
ncbi:Tryptophan synthase alpha chain [Dissostichus eleginoides]|uniref:Tryptophan synthase alpha chain n=1 Tax=Dissostichus eleginoides TaxID=100907 RepID=A0AAD9C572_DISEL|nr:Tryptophan synthase alpha chain [Dissostichus eleginoides]